jgi:hypothetical protein
MDIPAELLTVFPPSGQMLLDMTRRQVDDDVLDEIARADYGMDADLHLAALQPIRDDGVIPRPMEWHPREVLELIRWSEPERAELQPGAAGRRGHLMRTFACAVLLRADSDGEVDTAVEATLAHCLSGAKVLGQGISEAAGSFLTWRIPTMASTERWLFALGLMIVAMRFRNGPVTDHILGDTAEWFLGEEGDWRGKFRLHYNPADPPPAPVGLTYGRWKPLLAELLSGTATVHTEAVRDNLELIARVLLKES